MGLPALVPCQPIRLQPSPDSLPLAVNVSPCTQNNNAGGVLQRRRDL